MIDDLTWRSGGWKKRKSKIVNHKFSMKVIYYGHACFSVVVGGKTLLFDPFISGNPLAKAIDVKSVPADFILVSHGHARPRRRRGGNRQTHQRAGDCQLRGRHLAQQTRRAAHASAEPWRRFPIRFWPRQIRERHSFQHDARRSRTAEIPAASSSRARKAIFISPATPR